MNWVPLLFIDNVCHQLPSSALKPVSALSGTTWSSFGYEHCGKRREFTFGCRVEDQKCNYILENCYEPSEEVKVNDLNLVFDRFTHFALDRTCRESIHQRTPVSVDELQHVVLPTIASLATNCNWSDLDLKQTERNRMLLKAFQNCPGFNKIGVHDDKLSEESRDFLERQVELGNVESITMHIATARKWIEAETLANTLKLFVSSARFRELIVFDQLPNTFELFALFLERAIAGELKKGALIVIIGVSDVDHNRLSALHPEHREGSKELAWRIANSNRRIVEDQSKGILYYFGGVVLKVL